MKKLSITVTIFSFLPLLLISTQALAQGAPPATPIDGGLSLLLAAGGVYGLKKLREHKKK
ncbi:MAG: hypothetical protein JXR10_13860 [Cyclobacteriaceae bacterium]